ncbi:MAG: C25 family cysteine peptidase [Promethearchaeota archaeon]
MIRRKNVMFFLLIILMNSLNSIKIQDRNSSFLTFVPLKLNNSISNTSIDYLIITTNNFEHNLEPLGIWKTQKGLISKIETVEDIKEHYQGRNLAEKIKNCIVNYHTNNKTQWILLAGDHEHLPSQYVRIYDNYSQDGDFVCCDSYYSDLNNNWDLNNDGLWGTDQDEFDLEAEVYVGRLSANNKEEMAALVQKLINYEKIPVIGNWMTKAILASAILAFDQDWNDDNLVDFEECDGNRFNNFLYSHLPSNVSSTILALTTGIKGSNYSYNISLNYENFVDIIADGFSIGSFSLHGTETSLSYEEWLQDYDEDMLYDYTDDPTFGNGTRVDQSIWKKLVDTSIYTIEPEEYKMGMIFLLACSTGTFDWYEDCLAEYFLKNIAIGCVASSHVSWAEDQWYEREHGGWFAEGLAFRFWEQLFKVSQPGKALALAKADYISDRNNSSEIYEYPEWHDKVLKQFNLFGDPEVPIWLKIPKKLNITEVFITNISTTFQVFADYIPIENCTITLTKDNVLIWEGKTGEDGLIEIPFNKEQINRTTLTVSKLGYIPYQILSNEEDLRLVSIKGYDILIFSVVIIGLISISFIYTKNDILSSN